MPLSAQRRSNWGACLAGEGTIVEIKRASLVAVRLQYIVGNDDVDGRTFPFYPRYRDVYSSIYLSFYFIANFLLGSLSTLFDSSFAYRFSRSDFAAYLTYFCACPLSCFGSLIGEEGAKGG